ncbi:MAG: hypothetical protein AB7H77_04760 [Bdellovibrionales bacterium]
MKNFGCFGVCLALLLLAALPAAASNISSAMPTTKIVGKNSAAAEKIYKDEAEKAVISSR